MREAVAHRPEVIDEIFVVGESDIADAANDAGVRVTQVPEQVLLAMCETVHPRGSPPCAGSWISTLPTIHDWSWFCTMRDPGNAGTILRTADAAGADAVYLTGDSVDPYNGKVVRSTAGCCSTSVHADGPGRCVGDGSAQILATSGTAARDLQDIDLTKPTVWLFGNEAHGLPEILRSNPVAIPIFGSAESLNLASAAAVCLYASAFAQRG